MTPPMTRAEIERVAKGLSGAQKALLLDLPTTTCESYRPAVKLIALGLAYRKHSAYGSILTCSDPGIAVRDFLREGGDGTS